MEHARPDNANSMHLVFGLDHCLRRRGDTQTEKSEPGDYAETLASLVALSESLQHWHAMASHFGELPVVETISMRITMLERNLAGVGINLRNWGMIDTELAEAGEALNELNVAAREGRWQLRAISLEGVRHWTLWRPANPSKPRIWQCLLLSASLIAYSRPRPCR